MSRITLIQFRRDTYANWQTAGSILSLGEAGLDTTNKYLKIGDGSSTPFTSLTNYVYLGSLATAGTYGSTTSVPTLTINADGKLTGVGSTSISITESQVSGLSGKYAALTGATFTGAVSGTDLTLSGNLNVQGTQTIINTTNLAVNDSLIYLSDNQYDQDTVDIGIYGAYGFTGGDVNNHKHTGLVRKAGGGWHLVSGGSEPTNNTINLNTVNYDSLKLGNLSFNSNYSLSLGTGTITAINGSGPWVVSVTLSSAPSVLPVVGQYLIASGSQAIGGTNPAPPTPYSNPTSVVVSAVTDSTHIQYTVTGGNAPSFGLQNNAQYGAIQSIYTLTSAPLYIPSSVIQTDSFYGVTKIGAIENSGTTLYFTNDSGIKKTIAFLDSNNYSGNLSKTITFDSRYFTGGSFNNSSNKTLGLQDSGTYGSYGDESTLVDGGGNSYGGISPYAAKSPKYVLAGPSTTVQITAVYLNYTTSGAGVQNGYVRYEFSGYAGFTTSAPITVSGTSYSVLNVTLTPTAVVNNPAAANTTGGGYFIFNLTPGTAVSIAGFGANPNTTTGGQARSLTAALTRKPLFRQLNGDDVDLTYVQNFDGVNTGGNSLVVTDGDYTLKYMGLAPGSGSAQRQYFLRGDGYWGVPTNAGVQGVVGTNTLAISGADPSPTSATSTLTITPSVTSSYNGNLNLYATGTGVFTIGGQNTGGMTITGGTTGANAIGAATSIIGVTNTGNGGSAQGGPLNLDGGSGGSNATAGVLNLGLSSSAITLGASGKNITIAGTITGTTTFVTGGDAVRGLVIRRNSATQSSNLQEWSNETGSTTLAAVSGSGSFRTSGAVAAGSLTSIGQLTSVVPSSSPLTVGLAVRGASSQTADLVQYQNSATTVVGGRAANGQIYTGSTYPIIGATYSTQGSLISGTSVTWLSSTTATFVVSVSSQIFAASGQTVLITGTSNATFNNVTVTVSNPQTVVAGSQYSFTGTITSGSFGSTPGITATGGIYAFVATVSGSPSTAVVYLGSQSNLAIGDLIAVNNFTAATTGSFNTGTGVFVSVTAVSNTVPYSVSYLTPTATTATSGVTGGAVQTPAQASVTQSSKGQAGLIVQGANGAAATIFSVNDYNSNQKLYVNQFGNTLITNGLQVSGTSGSGSTAGTLVALPGVTNKGLIVKGSTSQTADLIQTQDGSGTVTGGANPVGQTYTGSVTNIFSTFSSSTSNPITGTIYGVGAGGTPTATTFQLTLTSASSLSVGDFVTVTGLTYTGLNPNGVYIVTGVSNTGTFYIQYGLSSTPGTVGFGSATVAAAAQASVTPRSAGTKGLVVKGIANQANNLQEWQDSTGAAKASISSSGALYTDTINGQTSLSATISLGASRNLALVTASPSYGSGAGIIMIGNAATPPSTNPTGGGILYVDTGALKYRGTSGSAATIVNADGTMASGVLSYVGTYQTTSSAIPAGTALSIATATNTSANTGSVTLTSGNGSGTGSNSGSLNLSTGNAGSTGNSGSIVFDVGTVTTGSVGSINVGTSVDAAVTIGKTAGIKSLTINHATTTLGSASGQINLSTYGSATVAPQFLIGSGSNSVTISSVTTSNGQTVLTAQTNNASASTVGSPVVVLGGTGNGTSANGGNVYIDGGTGSIYGGNVIIGTAAAGGQSANLIIGTPTYHQGSSYFYQGSAAAVNTTAVGTAANLAAQIITTTTAAAVAFTLPTGTVMDTGFTPSSGSLYNGMAVNWSVINTGSNSFTVGAGTSHTTVGGMVVTAGTSGAFRSARTGTNTWVTYRLS